MAAPQGVSLAFYDPALEPNPTWTRIDDPATYNVVTAWTIDRGRSYELDRTGTGNATVTIIDQNGIFDPTNASSPFYGLINPMVQAAIALQHPVTLTWFTLFRGFVTDWDYVMDVSAKMYTLTLTLADAFELLANLEMTPGNQGSALPIRVATATSAPLSDIYFPDDQQVDDRIKQALADAGWPTSLQTIFSGNVALLGTDLLGNPIVYARRDELLTVVLDAADAEFPGVANVYVSKDGIVTFHGRFARFNPTNPTYGISQWLIGDASVAPFNASVAPISSLEFNRSRKYIINSALALPMGVSDGDVTFGFGQVTDPISIAAYGWCSVSFDSLLTYHGDENPDLYGTQETILFAQYYVDNYAVPRTRVSKLGFRPIAPTSFNGSALWDLLCGIEISDIVNLSTSHPGGGGFLDEGFYVEGIHYSAVPMTRGYPEVTLELDVSPTAYFNSNPF